VHLIGCTIRMHEKYEKRPLLKAE